jgi:hypothetical protein
MDRSRGAAKKYPFDEMAVGDFFRLPSIYATVVRCSLGRQLKQGRRFHVRRDGDSHVCERVA